LNPESQQAIREWRVKPVAIPHRCGPAALDGQTRAGFITGKKTGREIVINQFPNCRKEEAIMAKEIKETKPSVRHRPDLEPRRFSDVERMFQNWFEDFWSAPALRAWRPDFFRMRSPSLEVPALDVYEQKDELVVKAEIPGLSKDEIDISLDGNMLTIKGEKKKEEEIKEEDYYRCERTFGAFARSVEIPAEVQTDKVSATFKNGVLEIHLPKTEEAKKNVVKVKVA
jgi:HSP20 family protein